MAKHTLFFCLLSGAVLGWALLTAPSAQAASLLYTCDQFTQEQCTVVEGVHILKINVYAPHYAFDMVMAHEAQSADEPSVREHVRAMVARSPNVERQPILAINADYFGVYGPEGLTVKQGVRILNTGRGGVVEAKRSSLSIAQDHTLRLGVQTDCTNITVAHGCVAWTPDPFRYFTTIGGGPLFIADGHRLQRSASDTLPCDAEDIDRRFCYNSFAWTAVGVTADGKTLIVAATPHALRKTMWQMSAILESVGAWRAMKLDSGGSTQLWYRGEEIVRSYVDRPIPNALMIFARSENCPLFCDVWLDNPFFRDIGFLRNPGLTLGYSDGTFRPDNPISRAEVASLIWRWLGQPEAPAGCSPTFPDLPAPDSPHYAALVYLSCTEVLRGYSDGTLRPDVFITRGESVTIFWRVFAALRPGVDPLIGTEWTAIRAELGRFPDAPGGGVHDDNVARSRWAGLVHGYGDGNFYPDRSITRGQFAKILTRALYFGEYTSSIFVPCTIDYAALFSAYTTPGEQAPPDADDSCRTPATRQSAPAQLGVQPAQVVFTIGADGQVQPPQQAIDVMVGGVISDSWQITIDQPWFTVDRAPGAAARTALVQLADAGALAPGQHTAMLTVAPTNPSSIQASNTQPTLIPITIQVAERITTPQAGDVSCDGVRDNVDALFILQYEVGLRTAATACPLAEGALALPACDLNADQTCTAVDALLLLQ